MFSPFSKLLYVHETVSFAPFIASVESIIYASPIVLWLFEIVVVIDGAIDLRQTRSGGFPFLF